MLKIKNFCYFLFIDWNRKPANIKKGRINIDNLMPTSGTIRPVNSINPIADPARSALYIAAVAVIFLFASVISLKIVPVTKAGMNPETISKTVTSQCPPEESNFSVENPASR